MRKALSRKFKLDKPPPCNDCIFFDYCKSHYEACGEFVHYWASQDGEASQVPVEQRVRIPSEKWYNDTFLDFVGYSIHRHGL